MEDFMAKYLVKSNYTLEGLKGLLKEGGTGRREAVEKAAASVGGKVESYYFAFGDTDVYAIFDFPDNVTATAVSLIANVAGTSTPKITVLLTPEEVDAATKITADYRPPGK
jgi:uncharacterized protein with GYD domain